MMELIRKSNLYILLLIVFISKGYSQRLIFQNIPLDLSSVAVNKINDSTTIVKEINMKDNVMELPGYGFYMIQYQLKNDTISDEFYLNEEVKMIDLDLLGHAVLEEIVINQYNLKSLDNGFLLNVENSYLSKNFDATEIMKRIPTVKVDDYGISIKNNSNIIVYINSKKITLTSEQLINLLRTIPSENIKSIEVNNNPGSKYASDISGLVIIKLKKKNEVFDAILKNTLEQKFYFNNSTNLALTANINKIQVSYLGNSNWNQLKKETITKYTSNRDEALNLKINNRVNKNNVNHYLDFNYDITTNTNTGLSYTNVNSKEKSINKIISDNNDNARTNQKLKSHVLNYYFLHKCDTLGSQFEINSTYVRQLKDDDNHFELFDDNNTVNQINIDLIGVDFSYLKKRKKVSYEFGASGNIINNDYYYKLGFSSDDFFYDESNLSVFAKSTFAFLKDIKVDLGLRSEFYLLKLDDIKRRYNFILPNIALSYKVKEDFLSFTFSKNVFYPNFTYYNPYEIFVSDNFYFKGNPFLDPFISTDVKVNYGINNMFFFNAYYNIIDDTIGVVNTQKDEYFYSTYENLYKSRILGIASSCYFNKDQFSFNLTIDNYYVKSDVYNREMIKRSGYVFLTYGNVDYKISKSAILSGNFLYCSSVNYSNSKVRPYGTLGLGITGNIYDNFSYRFFINDLFNSNNEKAVFYHKTYDVDSTIRNYQQGIGLSLIYKLGKELNITKKTNSERILN